MGKLINASQLGLQNMEYIARIKEIRVRIAFFQDLQELLDQNLQDSYDSQLFRQDFR
jgi:hypothetical protein